MNRDGFTLLELLVVIAVLSILASIALPAFQSVLRKQQVTGEVAVLTSAIYLARSEAVKRGSVVTICKSSDKQNCGGDWSDGWIVFQDTDNDGGLGTGELLITSGTVRSDYSLSWSAFVSNNYLRFTSQGLTLSHNGSFKLCPRDGDNRYARMVILSKTARLRISKDTNGDGIYEDASGNDITCG